jgi:hypothetical protein
MSLPTVATPTYTAKLLSYPKPVSYRPYLVKEEKLLLMAQQADTEEDVVAAISQIVRNCTFDKVDPSSLALFDLTYLFLLLRAKSVNNVIQTRFRCMNKGADDQPCNTPVPIDIDIDKIALTVPAGHTNKIWLDDDMGVLLKYPTFKTTGVTDADITSVLPTCLDHIFTKDGVVYDVKDYTPAEVTTFVESLSLAHVEKLRTFFETMPHLEHAFEFVCTKCGYREHIVLRDIMDFFD